MFTKAYVVVVALCTVSAQQHHNQHGGDHGHAYSSQSIVLHHSHGHEQAQQEVHYHGHQEQKQQHGQQQQYHTEQHGHNEYHVTDNQGQQEYHGHASSAQTIKLHHDGHKTEHVEYYGHPKYEFSYEVKDPHTHDIKHQHEHRDGDVVKGEYSLHQPDGVVRIVKYHADKKSGFNADVKYEGHSKHVAPEQHHHH